MVQSQRKPDRIPRLDRIRRGEPLSASKANRSVDVLNRLTQRTRPPRQVVPPPRPMAKLKSKRLTLKAMGPDHLECTDAAGAIVLVAKPWLVRRTPFDGQERDGVSYVYSADDRRVGTAGVAPDEETEIQEVFPRFVVGDEIYADDADSTGVEVEGVPVTRIAKDDSRSFAKVSE